MKQRTAQLLGVPEEEPFIEDKYYNPKKLFESDMYSLAPTFAQNRYSAHAPYDIHKNNDYSRNGAAVEIYNSEFPHINPRYFRALSNSRGMPRGTNYGHSEPRMMRDELDALLGNPNDFRNKLFEDLKIYPPSLSGRTNSRSDKEVDILSSLVRNAPDYKRYLTLTGKKLNALSELSMCEKNGGGCSQFMRNISPVGSKLGHTVPSGYKTHHSVVKEEAAKRLGPKYIEYMKDRDVIRAINEGKKNSYKPSFGFNNPEDNLDMEEEIVSTYPYRPARGNSRTQTTTPLSPYTPSRSGDLYGPTSRSTAVTPDWVRGYGSPLGNNATESPVPIYSTPSKSTYNANSSYGSSLHSPNYFPLTPSRGSNTSSSSIGSLRLGSSHSYSGYSGSNDAISSDEPLNRYGWTMGDLQNSLSQQIPSAQQGSKDYLDNNVKRILFPPKG